MTPLIWNFYDDILYIVFFPQTLTYNQQMILKICTKMIKWQYGKSRLEHSTVYLKGFEQN